MVIQVFATILNQTSLSNTFNLPYLTYKDPIEMTYLILIVK